jgi:hypothetical protein
VAISGTTFFAGTGSTGARVPGQKAVFPSIVPVHGLRASEQRDEFSVLVLIVSALFKKALFASEANLS